MDGDSLLGNGLNTLPRDMAEAIDTSITLEELKRAVRKGKPNKAPGGDGIRTSSKRGGAQSNISSSKW